LSARGAIFYVNDVPDEIKWWSVISRDLMGDSILSEKVPTNARSEMFLRKSRFTCIAPATNITRIHVGLRINLFPVACGNLLEHEFISERADFGVFDKQGKERAMPSADCLI